MAVNVVSFSFSWCSTGGPGVHSAGCWLPLLHLISNFSGPQTPSRFPRAPSAGCGFSYHLSSITPSPALTATALTSVLTELYISSTPTRSPTRSLEWHDWSSSSGNNCHAVHRSHSSGASVYESIMGFFSLSHFLSQFPPTRFPLLTDIGMYHFLLVHHLEWHFGPGRRSKYNIQTTRYSLVLTFKPTSKMWGGMMWPLLENIPKIITVAGNFVFITLGTSLLFVAIQICILRVLAMVLLS